MPMRCCLGARQQSDCMCWTRCEAGAVSRLVSAAPAILPVHAPCGCAPRLPHALNMNPQVDRLVQQSREELARLQQLEEGYDAQHGTQGQLKVR